MKTKILIAAILSFAMATVCLTGCDFGRKPSANGGQSAESDVGFTDSVTDGSGNVLESDKIHVLPKAMTFRTATAYTDNTTNTRVTLTATVKPDNATDKTVDWEVGFANPDSEWASGKTVTDYFTITPSTDGSTTATGQCLQAFGEQIVIMVRSRADTSKTATCTVDFAKRIESVSFNNTTTAMDISSGKYIVPSDSSVVGIKQNLVITSSVYYTAYTIDCKYTDVRTLEGTTAMAALLQASNAGSNVTAVVGIAPVVKYNAYVFCADRR